MQYGVILADPPWDYKDKKNNDPAMGGITYPTMTDEDIYNLDVRKIAAQDSLLFLWVTLPKLIEGIETVQRWGFKYITTPFVWLKLNPTGEIEYSNKDITLRGGIYSGLGHWTNGNVELVLMGKKGKPKRIRKDVKQVIISPRSNHSKKPKEIYNRIEALTGDVSRIELFARKQNPPPEGWHATGLEYDGKDIKEFLNGV